MADNDRKSNGGDRKLPNVTSPLCPRLGLRNGVRSTECEADHGERLRDVLCHHGRGRRPVDVLRVPLIRQPAERSRPPSPTSPMPGREGAVGAALEASCARQGRRATRSATACGPDAQAKAKAVLDLLSSVAPRRRIDIGPGLAAEGRHKVMSPSGGAAGSGVKLRQPLLEAMQRSIEGPGGSRRRTTAKHN